MFRVHSQFDGNAAFSGGGFMPSQATQTADPSHASSSKRNDSQPLVPLTVKQISEALQASDDNINFLIDGVDVNNVKLVGIICNKAERVTDVSFTIDDGTGFIDCYRWVNEAIDSKEMEAVSNGMYVRVHGHLKGFQGKKQLMVFSVRPVADYNEIANHFADCIFVHIYNTKSQKMQDTAPTPAPAQIPTSGVNTPMRGYQADPSSAQYSMNELKAGLKAIDRRVLEYLQQPECLARERGVHRDELAQKLNVPVQKIQEAIEYLEIEGLAYATIDDCHYKSTGNG